MQKKYNVKYTALVASSIDGRIAKDSRSFADWTSKEDWNFFQTFIAKVDVVIVGYNTYKVAKERLDKRNTIVFTSKYNKIKEVGSVVFLNPALIYFKEFIEQKGYKKIAILGGPAIYNYFLENKMLDELLLTIEPIIFTNGIPMFLGKKFKKYELNLVSVKKLNKKGTLLLKYKNNAN